MKAEDTYLSPQFKEENKGYMGSLNQSVMNLLDQQADNSFKEGGKQARWEVGEELCCLIGNLMLEDMEAGKLLGSQLEEYMNHYLKERGPE